MCLLPSWLRGRAALWTNICHRVGLSALLTLAGHVLQPQLVLVKLPQLMALCWFGFADGTVQGVKASW